jgi:GAF domain-containing protein
MNEPAARGDDHRPPRVGQLLAEYGPDVEAMCDACVRHLPGISGVGVAVMTRLPAQAIRYASNPVSERVEELQVVLGEGPCVDAFSAGQPVLASDLDQVAWGRRWPAFAPEALAAGARAVFALPLQIGAARVGVMDLHREAPGWLQGVDLADALVFADATTQALLIEAHARDVQEGQDLYQSYHAVVHQATGMVKVQLSVGIAEALVRLRAYAYAQERPIEDVAHDVVGRRLRFDELSD